jgi:transketolase
MADLRQTALTLRRRVIDMLWHAQAGHPGGSLSAAELFAVLYFYELRLDPTDPGWEERDRFVLSKGHAAPTYYATLQERGFFPAGLLHTYDKIDSCLQAHPDCRAPGVDMPSGSLGQGLSAGIGMALGARTKGLPSRVYVMLGDGELQEGQIWEAAMAAPKFGLDNLVAIVDDNRVQLTGPTASVMPIEPLADKWRAFNWSVLEIDGHDVEQIVAAFDDARARAGGPTVIIAHTVKGRGVSFMENRHEWHSGLVTDEVRERALAELNAGNRGPTASDTAGGGIPDGREEARDGRGKARDGRGKTRDGRGEA